MTTQTSPQHTTTWPQGVIARYLTLAGAALTRDDLAVEVKTLTTIDGEPYATRSTCRGCTAWEDQDYVLYRNYRDEADQVRAAEADAREWAHYHATTCRAIPRPQNR